ncbi:hypothetical protein Tco_1328572 [Tanacetum coccineum]
MFSQTTLTQPIEASPLAIRELVFSTNSNSPIEPHPYLPSMDDLPPRSTNHHRSNRQLKGSKTKHSPQYTTMDFKPFFPLINLFRRGSRMSAQPEPLMSRDQVLQQLGQLYDFSNNLEAAIQNAQNVQDSLLPHLTTTSSPIPLSSYSPPPL